MNRALNGDLVAVELLPKSQWVVNYKPGEPLNFMLDEEEDVPSEN